MSSTLATPSAATAGAMEIDAVMPEFDATRVEHRIIDASVEQVYRAVREADFVDAPNANRAVRFLFALRTSIEHLVSRLRGRPLTDEEKASWRLADMRATGDWIALGEDPPHEFTFGAIGRFWGGETKWRRSDASDFATFAEPGFARIACNFSLRTYGDGRTLVSYEARTQATDPRARRAFLRYWCLVSPMVGVVMRSGLSVVGS